MLACLHGPHQQTLSGPWSAQGPALGQLMLPLRLHLLQVFACQLQHLYSLQRIRYGSHLCHDEANTSNAVTYAQVYAAPCLCPLLPRRCSDHQEVVAEMGICQRHAQYAWLARELKGSTFALLTPLGRSLLARPGCLLLGGPDLLRLCLRAHHPSIASLSTCQGIMCTPLQNSTLIMRGVQCTHQV